MAPAPRLRLGEEQELPGRRVPRVQDSEVGDRRAPIAIDAEDRLRSEPMAKTGLPPAEADKPTNEFIPSKKEIQTAMKKRGYVLHQTLGGFEGAVEWLMNGSRPQPTSANFVIGREEGPVKVGITSTPNDRLRNIQTGCHFKIEILHIRECSSRAQAISHEESFHRVYDEKRLAGEWFDLESDLAIEGIDTGFEYEEHFALRAKEEKRDWMIAQLNIWQWGEDGAHPHH